MAQTELPRGVVTRENKDGSVRYYFRHVWRENGKQFVRTLRLPDFGSPSFATELAKCRAEFEPAAAPEPRKKAAAGTVAALVQAFRPTLDYRKGQAGPRIAAGTRRLYDQYLGQIEREHGDRKVRDLRKAHLNTIRDRMAETPGRANSYIKTFRVLLEFAVDNELIDFNPGAKVSTLDVGEHDPWPEHVIDEVLAYALREGWDVFRLAVISGLYSGQRVSDLIRMRDDWMSDGFMRVPASKKTDTPATIALHPVWAAEIERVKTLRAGMKIQPVTLLYTRYGTPFGSPIALQGRMRKAMRKLGYVDGRGQALYSFHGLSKNFICAMTEQGVDETTLEAIVGKTPATLRHYGKKTRRKILAERAANVVVSLNFGGKTGVVTRA